MLNIVYGGFGISQSKHLYSRALKSLNGNNQCYFVVPEQEALLAEKKIYELTSDVPSLGLHVINFQKLCEEIFRKCGGLAKNYINDSAKKLLLKKAVSDLSPALSVYSEKADDDSFIGEMLLQITEFKYAAITPSTLARVSKSIADNTSLSTKLSDISLIYTAFDALINEKYDDPCDDLTKCAELILKSKPIENTEIFFDSFNGFTVQQFQIIQALLKSNNNVTVSLCLPDDSSKNDRGIYTYTLETEQMLLKIAQASNVKVNKIVITSPISYVSRDIARLSSEFSVSGKADPEKSDGSVRAVSCTDIFDECETVAALIAQNIRQGAKYSDIAIITRNTERYKGIIDAVLERHDIPVFFSVKTDITEKALIRYILSALTVCTGYVKFTDIISHIRCGLSPLSDFECDLLEAYAAAWNIKGKIWWDPDGFKMNPNGYKSFNEKDNQALLVINSIKQKLMTPLEELKEELKKSKTVSDYSKAIYLFLQKSEITRKLATRAESMKARNEAILASEELGIWSSLCSAFDILCDTIGTYECSCDEFIKYFKLLLTDIEIGTIPQTNDVVTVGDAALLRADNIRHAYLIGCEDGVFPQGISEPSLLCAKERKILSEYKLQSMEFDPSNEASKELFLFVRAAVLPTDTLTLTYSRTDGENEVFPSFAFSRICKMFNNILLESGEYDLSLKIFSPEAFAEYSPILSSVGLKDKIESFKSENLELCKSSHLYDVPICTTTEKISEKTVKSVHSGNLYLSQSATDAFSSCPFAFHCKYSLKLKNRSNSSIASSDLGTLIHSILQNFLESTSSRGILKSDELTAEEISRIIRDEIAKSSALLLEFTSDDKKARVKHLLDRIADITVLTASNLVDEFRQSGFEPAFFELPIREYGDNALIPIKIALDDGSFIVLGGICDRVDTMVKDDTLYVRVADYKSGDKVFSLDNIRVGQSLQLLIYLFSIWENADKKFKLTAKAKITDTVIPAGAEYVMTTPSAIEASIESTYESLLEMLSHSFKRSGIYLSDQSILEAMDKGLTTKYIPVKDNLKDQKGTVLMTVEQLQELKTEVGKILVEIGNSIKHGKADALPLPADSKAGRTYDACAFCEMKPICKNISNAYFDEDESN